MRETGKYGKPLITTAEYGRLCHLAELGTGANLREDWTESDEAGFYLTSDWAREFADIVCEILGLDKVPVNRYPYPDGMPPSSIYQDMWDSMADMHGGDWEKFARFLRNLAAARSPNKEQA